MPAWIFGPGRWVPKSYSSCSSLWNQFSKAVCTSAIQLQYSNFFLVLQLYCTCVDPCNTSCNTSFLQLAENLQATCSSCKKLVLRLYCAYAHCCNTTKFLCYVMVVVLHFCGPLKGPKIPKAFLIHSRVQQNFARTFVPTLPADLPSQIFHLLSN